MAAPTAEVAELLFELPVGEGFGEVQAGPEMVRAVPEVGGFFGVGLEVEELAAARGVVADEFVAFVSHKGGVYGGIVVEGGSAVV